MGQAIETLAGLLKCKYIIHAPTMELHEKSDEHKVKCAVEAALELAEELHLHSLVMPGMGTGVGMLDKDSAAKVMLKVIRAHKAVRVEEIILVDIDEDMVKAWSKWNKHS